MKVASSSLVLSLPTYWILVHPNRPDTVSSYAHVFAGVALVMLAVAAMLGLFAVGLAVFAVNLEIRERWLIAGLSFPALLAAAIVLYILANIPPT